MSLRIKLFLALLLSATLAVVGAQAFVRWSFLNGLQELASARERGSLELVVERLQRLYESDGDWQALRANARPWAMSRTDPEPFDSSHSRLGESEADSRRAPGDHRSLRRAPRSFAERLLFKDADNRWVIGPRDQLDPARLAGASTIPVQLQGERIGTLVLLPGRPAGDAAQRLFQREHGKHLWMIALAMVILSALLAFPTAALLSRPLVLLQHSARRLADGDYQARAAIDTRDELGRLASDLNTLAKTLARNQEARRRWIADISHELRTPLGLLRAEVEALRDGLRQVDDATLAHLHGAVLRLGRLVEDLNELTRTEPGALSYRMAPVDVADVVRTLVSSLHPSFADRGLDLALECVDAGPWTLSADADRLRQLFGNLLHNSLAYTDPGGRVMVRLASNPTGLLIDVEDSAPGVPDAALALLFERLYRVETSRNRAGGGAGLGLAIARNIVCGHGGTILASHAPLGGLRIRVQLPWMPDRAAVPQEVV